ncbi:NADPH:quinone oxidoreductase family protein [Sphingomonas naphthae]|uniref:NADPH:quinone oxidoreductase family protein n=1 Tax=Sphingomonas naphthae TaxID=1813468 RepID=A0ABY7THI3_9SPHN|nr:NADPH:quinone oxidoreductase family protein [Sphingomonas naphthae]WCT72177.1 NADPH:quinone oxidoreductase family protein [Sphingomonas naphthae]
MRAIVCEHFGTPDVVVLKDMPVPEPGCGEVRIRAHAAAVNFPDVLHIANKYQKNRQPPFIPGLEVAGVVDSVGDGVVRFRAGDRVCSSLDRGGTFAEYVIAAETRCSLLPETVSFATAAAMPLTYGTTLHALRDRGRLQAGETLLVLGAGGGVGTAAIDLGKRMGARVIAAASSPEKLALARNLGADETIDYSREDVKVRAREIAGSNGIDVIYDPVGSELSEAAFRALGWYGRHLVIGFARGTIPALPLNLPLLKNAELIGVHWGTAVEQRPDLYRMVMDDVIDGVASGGLSPRISARYPLEKAADALAEVAAGRALGKVVVEIA